MEKSLYTSPALKHYIFHFLLASSASVFRIVGSNYVGITDKYHRQLSPMSAGNQCRPPISYLCDRTRGLASAITRWHFNGYSDIVVERYKRESHFTLATQHLPAR